MLNKGTFLSTSIGVSNILCLYMFVTKVENFICWWFSNFLLFVYISEVQVFVRFSLLFEEKKCLPLQGIEPRPPDSNASVLSIQPRPLLMKSSKTWEVNLLCFDSRSAGFCQISAASLLFNNSSSTLYICSYYSMND